MKLSRTMRFAAVGMFAGGVWTMAFAPVVEAIVGAPVTPVSVAGVARRTARRTTAVVASSTPTPAPAPAAAPAAAAPAAPAASGMIASLPAGCEAAGELFRCGNVYYRPYMQGSTVVYAKVSGQ